MSVGRARRDNEGGRRKATRALISTLDGGCHDARWLAAGMGPAPVLTKVVAEQHAPRQAAMAGAGAPGSVSVGSRPW